MQPGVIGVVVTIAAFILLVSGWGDQILQSSQLPRPILILFLVAFLLLQHAVVPGIWIDSITIPAGILPFFVVCFGLARKKGWHRKLLLLGKGTALGCGIGITWIGFHEWMTMPTPDWYWLSVPVSVGFSFGLAKSFLDRWAIILLAIETAVIWLDLCIRYIPPEHLVIGHGVTQDLLVVGTTGLWCLMTVFQITGWFGWDLNAGSAIKD
jgi:hypothetical protein